MAVFPKFKEKWGEPIDKEVVSEEIINKYKNKLPNELIDLWKEDGFGGYLKGSFWTVNPDKYLQYLKKWANLNRQIYVIGRSSFGDIIIMYLSTKKEWIFKCIDVRHHEISLITVEKYFNDFFEICLTNRGKFIGSCNGTEDYVYAYKEIGQINRNQCYGFEPILALGGEEKLANVKIYDLDVHLELLTSVLEEPLEG